MIVSTDLASIFRFQILWHRAVRALTVFVPPFFTCSEGTLSTTVDLLSASLHAAASTSSFGIGGCPCHSWRNAYRLTVAIYVFGFRSLLAVSAMAMALIRDGPFLHLSFIVRSASCTPAICRSGFRGIWDCPCVLWLLHRRRLLVILILLFCYWGYTTGLVHCFEWFLTVSWQSCDTFSNCSLWSPIVRCWVIQVQFPSGMATHLVWIAAAGRLVSVKLMPNWTSPITS